MENLSSIRELLDLTAAVPLVAGILQRFGGEQGMMTVPEQKAVEFALGRLETRRADIERAAGLADDDAGDAASGIPDGEEAQDLFS
jgi:hypothetical protein